MPGAWKSQPAPGKAQGFRGQDTVERHGGLSIVMEKIVQWEQENLASKDREMIDDFRLWGSGRGVVWVDHLQKGGCARRWRVPSTTPTLHSQRVKPSPLWSRLCRETRIGSGLARIAQILWGKAPWGVGIACPPPLAHRVVAPHRRGMEVEGANPRFLALVRHRGGGGGARQNPPPLPFSGSLNRTAKN